MEEQQDEPMKRTRISDKIEYVEPDTMRNFTACAGIIVSSSPKILIDTNMGIRETKELLMAERPDIAIITHYHLDHSTWGPLVLEYSDAELFIPEGEQNYLDSLDYFIEKTAAPYGLALEWRNFAKDVTHYEEIINYSTYLSSTRFKTDRVTIECIKTSGHSPSHTSFYFPEENILFTGDMGVDRFGPWYGWIDCNLRELIDSILVLKSLKADILLTSHGGIITSDIEQVWNRALGLIFERERFIRDGLDRGRTKQEIVEQGIYFKNKSRVQEPVRSFLYMWDSIMFDHHRAILEDYSLEKLFRGLHEIYR